MALDASDPEAVRAAAREILSHPEFATHEMTWWRQLLYYVGHPGEALTDAFDWVLGQFSGGGAGVVIAWIAVAILLSAAVTLIVALTRTTSHDNVVPVGFVPNARYRSAAEFLADAERLEREQQWREAIRMRYAALLAELGASGFLRLRPGRTTGEYFAEVRSNLPVVTQPFGEATMLFESAWYGDVASTSVELEQFKACSAGVQAKAAA